MERGEGDGGMITRKLGLENEQQAFWYTCASFISAPDTCSFTFTIEQALIRLTT